MAGEWRLSAWLSFPTCKQARALRYPCWVEALIHRSGVLLQTTATTAAQFTIGRFISFGMTGMTIVVVPIYTSETAPKVLRGMMTSTLQLMIVLGQLVAGLVTFGTQNITSDRGWQIPVSLQFICPTLILVLLPLVPESPRWSVTAFSSADLMICRYPC